MHSKIAVIGSGDAGKSLVSLLKQRGIYDSFDIRIIDPKKTYTYQSGLTLVGAGKKKISEIQRQNRFLVPFHSDFIQDNVVEINPENNEIRTEINGSFYYDHLIIAPGTQATPSKTEGLLEALEDRDSPVGSIYLPKYAIKYSELRENLVRKKQTNGIKAVFTQPSTPIKCGGAPQKILHLSHETWTKDKLDVDYSFLSGGGKLFPSDYYIPELTKQLTDKNVDISLNSELIKVDGRNRTAFFKDTQSGTIFEKNFDILHATPVNVPPAFIAKSGLANPNGYVNVNKETFQHNNFTNIWSIGDAADLPTSKTNSAVNAQIWILARNLEASLKGIAPEELDNKYGGYTACPVLLGDNKVMICEFGYNGEPRNSFKVLKNTKGHKVHYFLKTQVFNRLNLFNLNKFVNLGLDK